MSSEVVPPTADGRPALPAAPDRLALPPHADGRPARGEPAAPRPAGGFGWKPLAVLAAVVAVGGGLFAVGLVPRLRDKSTVKQTAAAADEPANVNVIVAAPAPAETDVVLPGNTRADEETSVLARTNGYLEKWLVDIGDRVAAGQLMGVIATPEVEQELQQTKAALLQAQASVLQSKANLEQSRATRLVNKQNFDRVVPLVKSGAATSQENDTAEANLRTAEANVAAGTAAVGVAEANVGAAAANVRRLEDLLAFRQVRAPYAGVVTARTVDTGALITAGSAASQSAASSGSNATGAGAAAGAAAPGAAQALFRVARTDPIRVVVNVPQAFTPYVRVGSASEVRVREYPGKPFIGKVSRTANALDPTARTLTTEVLVPNPDGRLVPGAYVQVKFVQKRDKPPIIVPGGALITRTDGTVVAIVGDGDKIDYRKVEVGRDFGTKAEVVTGLTGGERVCVNLVEEPPAGTVVKPVPMPEEPAAKK